MGTNTWDPYNTIQVMETFEEYFFIASNKTIPAPIQQTCVIAYHHTT